MITIENVSKRFGRNKALAGVNLNIAAGESVALWGANGAGKTTLLRCVLGLLRFEGRISIGGHDVARSGKCARMLVGYVPQELGFYDDLRVAEAVVFFAKLKRLSVESINSVLSGVGLVGHERKRIRELSGGMKQRLALAIAMLGDPPVLVLDEVTASLDACGRGEFVALLRQLAGAGRTFLFASHRIEEVTTLAQRVIVLEQGRIASECDASSFMNMLGVGTVLHLTMPPHTRDDAMTVLKAGGFDPRYNGVGLFVPVPTDQKAAPFRLLAEARIAVSNFEILSGQDAHGHREEVRA